MIRRIAVGVVAAGIAACGGSVPNSSGATSADLAAYQAVGQNLAEAVQTYSVQASASPNQTACQQVQAQYDRAAGPLVDRMHELSRNMDRHMDGLGSHELADMDCVAGAMAAEMEHHRTEACTATDPATNQAEAAHHATTMVDWIEHQRIRYQDLAAMSGMMQAHTESTFSCQANPDGTYTFTNGGTQTHYPDPAHQGGSTPGPTPTPTPTPCPNPWPAPCHDSPCHPESGGMH
jgi:hypothetical protein